MSKPLIGPIHLLGAALMLAPLAAMSAASPEKHAKVSRVTDAPAAAHHQVHDDDQTWMMLPVGLAAIGFAIRRQQRVIDPLQPQVT